jgi:hypothetical protein
VGDAATAAAAACRWRECTPPIGCGATPSPLCVCVCLLWALASCSVLLCFIDWLRMGRLDGAAGDESARRCCRCGAGRGAGRWTWRLAGWRRRPARHSSSHTRPPTRSALWTTGHTRAGTGVEAGALRPDSQSHATRTSKVGRRQRSCQPTRCNEGPVRSARRTLIVI